MTALDERTEKTQNALLHELEPVVAENVKRESVEEPLGSQRDQLTLWRDGGASRAEWQKRDGDGRMEMRQLLASWATLEPADFLLLKARFAV